MTTARVWRLLPLPTTDESLGDGATAARPQPFVPLVNRYGASNAYADSTGLAADESAIRAQAVRHGTACEAHNRP
jgi:hypothetical protein